MRHDPATLDDLLAHAEWMRGLARRLLGDRDEADDVVQETWLSALRLPPTRDRTLRPWIATVMRNLVRTRARGKARSRTREERWGAPEAAPAADELLAQHETERRLAQLVLALDEPYRRTILQRFHDGQSSVEIAREEGIPEGTVRWRLKHGLDELRRRLAEGDERGERALGALIPMAGPPVVPVPPPAAAPWLGSALLQAKAVAIAVGAAAALAIVAAGVRPHHPVAATAAGSRVASPARKPNPATWSALPSGPAAPVEGLDVPQPQPPPGPAAPSMTLTNITGIVRDSRGDTAARVPVTLRSLAGSGVADRITATDENGRFSYQVRTRGSFMLTAELQGEPAARVQIAVPVKTATTLDAIDRSRMACATMDVALDSSPRPGSAPVKAPDAHAAQSRWCCRQAFAVGEVVYGRACLRFEDSRRSDQSGCELYNLKTQVSCHHRVHGGLSTGDLSRTDRLDCDGRVL
jgi:RNA polymerase sigma-70 factor (ECF subfamily)